MLSLDECRAWLETEGKKAFADLAERVEALKKEAVAMGCGIPEGKCDPLRISLRTAAKGVGGLDAAEYFRRNGVEPEYADDEWVVFIPSPMNSAFDFARLKNALAQMPRGEAIAGAPSFRHHPAQAMPLREAVLAPCELVEVQKSCGRISAETACPCPPGVALLCLGRKLTATRFNCY